MALPLLAIGEALLSHGLPGVKGTGHAKGLLGASFGSTLKQKLDQLGTDGGDILSQLAGLLSAGTPLATIIDRVAKQVSDALASATGNDGNATRRRTLERALAAALAPPGTSPPGSSGLEQAASLENRLRDILSKVTRELQTAGQQNRFSGSVLDANSARETPAQQTKDPTGTQTPAGSLAFADSILRSVMHQLQSAAPQTPQTPQPPQASSLQGAQQSAAAAQITVQSTDVLGRMLARAAKADPSAAASRATGSGSPAPSASDLFARLMNVIAQTAGERSSQQNGKNAQDFASSNNALAPVHHSPSPANGTAVPAFSAAINAASAPPAQSASLPPVPYAVDPQSVIEQVVKGIVLRNFGTTSEVRMRLQPEHLGDVSLKLTVTGSTISANIVAQNADVRDMLMQNQQQLARSLAEAGLSLGNFSVDVSGGNPGFSQQHSQQPHRSLRSGALHVDTAAEDDPWADSRFGPPVLTGARSLVLNYLA